MASGTLFVLGFLLLPLALVSMLAAWIDGRLPYTGAGLLILAAGLIGYVQLLHPDGGHALADLPDLALGIIAATFFR
ncbi:hypothetical protein [Roseicitreum antarcticum]|uniref:Uncharacterized protein n=1 Tax=Roseicitreum antarcticum TaxID=564137 RepID=A0A1H2S2Y9_9RHOB|nr:hypothetical protein [Roseicitreum antarcticum]SDW25971.1 hypothetical protein SAMN04488238_101485 [Roseicitreum antarcticum]